MKKRLIILTVENCVECTYRKDTDWDGSKCTLSGLKIPYWTEIKTFPRSCPLPKEGEINGTFKIS